MPLHPWSLGVGGGGGRGALLKPQARKVDRQPAESALADREQPGPRVRTREGEGVGARSSDPSIIMAVSDFPERRACEAQGCTERVSKPLGTCCKLIRWPVGDSPAGHSGTPGAPTT